MPSRLLEVLQNDPQWMKRPFFVWIERHAALILLCLSLFLLYGYFLAHKIDLTTADLGRHIKNGEMLLQDSSVLSENLYSYTHPDFKWVNHHWASGVLAYAAWKLFGFVGIQVIFILLSFATLAVFLFSGKSYAGWGIAGLLTLATISLLGERTEVRPEVISYLFAGLFFLLLCRYRDSPDIRNSKLIWLLPLIEILWVNTHVYFLLGPLIIGAFLLESLLVRRVVFFRILSVFLGVLFAMLINSFGVRAVTAAATIFQNYGYRLAENQPVWFMEKLMPEPNFLVFKLLFLLLLLSFIGAAIRNWRAVRLSNLFVGAGMSIMAWFAIRNLALFGLFFIPVAAANARIIFGNQTRNHTLISVAAFCAAVVCIIFTLFGIPRYFPYWREFGLGLETGNSRSIEFLFEQKIQGPIFNNYDIGGYLIFYLFPKEKVFVDNRPEAYPVAFFTDLYIPMQEKEEKWREALSRYDFNVIVFAYHDATPWAQQFLTTRIKDAEWAPVFVDGRVLVLLRRTEKNEETIRQFELPRSVFNIKQ